MKTVNQALGFDQHQIAQFRLRCIHVLNQQGYAGVQLAFPHVSRRSVYRWQAHYRSSGQTLTSLVPCSTRPTQLRQLAVSPQVLSFIKAIRQQHPHLSKYKLQPFLTAWCKSRGLPSRSASWIGKVIRRHQLFFGERHRVYRRRKQARSGYMIKRTPNPHHLKLGYLQLDGVKVYWAGEKLIFLTALELKTRTAWVKLVPTLSSTHAASFLQEILAQLPYPLHTIHTDNGSEFKAVFDQVVQALGLLHLWSPPRSPKIHSHIERFNGTFQAEFVDYHVDTAVTEPEQFQQLLKAWLIWYNWERPHHALNLMTPHQYLLHLQEGGTLSAKCL